jgi:hypothetical protein
MKQLSNFKAASVGLGTSGNNIFASYSLLDIAQYVELVPSGVDCRKHKKGARTAKLTNIFV